MQKSGGIPAAYIKIEWIESTGTQYFVTDVTVQEGLTVESIQTISGTSDSYLFGGAVDSENHRSCFNGFYNKRPQGAYPVDYYLASSLNYDTVYDIRTTHENGKVTMYVDSSLFFERKGSITISDTGVKCLCFAAWKSDGTVYQRYRGKLYGLKVSKGNNELANYIPCIRKTDNKPGMYDTVTKTFYTNAGTGEFIIPE